MANRKVSTAERGKFKQIIHSVLYKSKDVQSLIFDGESELSARDKQKTFKKYVQSHLFIDETITEAKSYIFYDVRLPRINTNTKNCQVILYAVCHRDILDNYSKEGFYGNRADILSQMVEDCLLNDEQVANSFGIGKLSLDSVDIYNAARLYGVIMVFNVLDFRWT